MHLVVMRKVEYQKQSGEYGRVCKTEDKSCR